MTTRTERDGQNIHTRVVDNDSAESGGTVSNGLASKEPMYGYKYKSYEGGRRDEHPDEGYEYEMSISG
jgi:hypothetical protein